MNIKHLVSLAEAWNSRALHDIAASKGGIGEAGRLAIQSAKRRKTAWGSDRQKAR